MRILNIQFPGSAIEGVTGVYPGTVCFALAMKSRTSFKVTSSKLVTSFVSFSVKKPSSSVFDYKFDVLAAGNEIFE